MKKTSLIKMTYIRGKYISKHRSMTASGAENEEWEQGSG